MKLQHFTEQQEQVLQEKKSDSKISKDNQNKYDETVMWKRWLVFLKSKGEDWNERKNYLETVKVWLSSFSLRPKWHTTLAWKKGELINSSENNFYADDISLSKQSRFSLWNYPLETKYEVLPEEMQRKFGKILTKHFQLDKTTEPNKTFERIINNLILDKKQNTWTKIQAFFISKLWTTWQKKVSKHFFYTLVKAERLDFDLLYEVTQKHNSYKTLNEKETKLLFLWKKLQHQINWQWFKTILNKKHNDKYLHVFEENLFTVQGFSFATAFHGVLSLSKKKITPEEKIIIKKIWKKMKPTLIEKKNAFLEKIKKSSASFKETKDYQKKIYTFSYLESNPLYKFLNTYLNITTTKISDQYFWNLTSHAVNNVPSTKPEVENKLLFWLRLWDLLNRLLGENPKWKLNLSYLVANPIKTQDKICSINWYQNICLNLKTKKINLQENSFLDTTYLDINEQKIDNFEIFWKWFENFDKYNPIMIYKSEKFQLNVNTLEEHISTLINNLKKENDVDVSIFTQVKFNLDSKNNIIFATLPSKYFLYQDVYFGDDNTSKSTWERNFYDTFFKNERTRNEDNEKIYQYLKNEWGNNDHFFINWWEKHYNYRSNFAQTFNKLVSFNAKNEINLFWTKKIQPLLKSIVNSQFDLKVGEKLAEESVVILKKLLPFSNKKKWNLDNERENLYLESLLKLFIKDFTDLKLKIIKKYLSTYMQLLKKGKKMILFSGSATILENEYINWDSNLKKEFWNFIITNNLSQSKLKQTIPEKQKKTDLYIILLNGGLFFFFLIMIFLFVWKKKYLKTKKTKKTE